MPCCALPSPGCMLRMIIIENAHLARWLDAFSVFLSMKFRSRISKFTLPITAWIFFWVSSRWILEECEARTKECVRNRWHVVQVDMPVIQLAGRSTSGTICYPPDKRRPPVTTPSDFYSSGMRWKVCTPTTRRTACIHQHHGRINKLRGNS